ncbi:MAG: type II toxin-antitoxin system VapC family toxin [Pseudomonadota bacterium]
MSARLLLDTHVWFWVLTDSPALPRAMHERIEASASRAISAASLYEVRLKHRLGKLPLPGALVDGLVPVTRSSGIEVLPMTGEIAERAAGYPWAHRDPFDRIIAATSEMHALELLTQDAALHALGYG